MRRIVSVWLPDWPIERLRRHDPKAVPPGEPVALAASGRHGLVITALTAEAAAGGVRPGMALADARALLPALRSHAAEPSADRRALVRLARWCGRYGPGRNIDIGPGAGGGDGDLLRDHGIWIDVTGVAHLFGGEAALLSDLARRLAGFGLIARLGLADTLGAAHALARYATDGHHGGKAPGAGTWRLAPAGHTAAALAALPAAALRISAAETIALRRLGLGRIGDLDALPRQTVERRFRGEAGRPGVLARLDQALGRAEEPRRPLAEVPALALRHAFPAPLAAAQVLEAETRRLIEEMCALLEVRGLGARRIRVVLYRADGTMAEAAAGTSTPVQSAPRLARLLADRLAELDAGLGIDMIAVEVPVAERAVATAVPLSEALVSTAAAAAAELTDRLTSRLGAGRVGVLCRRDSHIPERSEMRRAALEGLAEPGAWPRLLSARPPILLARPEPITVTAEVPDGAPASFIWRRIVHRVARAEGPERIAPEWWRSLPAPAAGAAAAGPDGASASQPAPRPDAPRTRDYYRLENGGGGGYWVFRNGLYGEEADASPPAWFLHGVFA